MDLDASISPAMSQLLGIVPEKGSAIESSDGSFHANRISPSVVGVLGRFCLPRTEIVYIVLDHARRIDERPSQGPA